MKFIHHLFLLPLLLGSFSLAATTKNGVTLEAIAGLSGDSTFAIWDTLNSSTLTGSGGFPGNTLWSPQNSQAGSTENDTQLVKISNGSGGGAFGSSSSMYYGGFSGDPNVNGGTVALSSSNPLAGLQTVLFQIQIGEAVTHDFYNEVLPTLSFTVAGDSTTYSLTASATSLYDQFYNGTVAMPTGDEPLYINSYAMWFDLSAISGDVDSYSVSWNAVQHAQVYGVSIQQDNVPLSDSSLLPSAVPEPSTALLGALGSLALLRRRR